MPLELSLTALFPKTEEEVPAVVLLVVEDMFMLLNPWVWCPMAPSPHPNPLVSPEVVAAALAAQLLYDE